MHANLTFIDPESLIKDLYSTYISPSANSTSASLIGLVWQYRLGI